MARAFLFVLDSFWHWRCPRCRSLRRSGRRYAGAYRRTLRGWSRRPQRSARRAAATAQHVCARPAARCQTLDWRIPGWHACAGKALRALWCSKRSLAWQGYSIGPLGNCRRAGYLRLGYFPTEGDAFPPELVEAICREAQIPGILGNCHASAPRSLRSSVKSISAPVSRSATPPRLRLPDCSA